MVSTIIALTLLDIASLLSRIPSRNLTLLLTNSQPSMAIPLAVNSTSLPSQVATLGMAPLSGITRTVTTTLATILTRSQASASPAASITTASVATLAGQSYTTNCSSMVPTSEFGKDWQPPR